MFACPSYLALVCLLKEENFEKHGLIDFNIDAFKTALYKVFNIARPKADEAAPGREAGTGMGAGGAGAGAADGSSGAVTGARGGAGSRGWEKDTSNRV